MLETRGKSHFGDGQYTENGSSDDLALENKSGKQKQQVVQDSDAIHTLATSNGSPYQNYQMRIAYATYNLIKEMPGGSRHVAFTRILHRTKDDELMDEIPTFRADPLQPKCDDWCDYPVSDRANAVRQFFEAAKKNPDMIKANWLYMIESDYVFMKPLQPPPSKADDTVAWGFPFDYIRPQQRATDMRKLFPEEMGPVSKIPGTGPAPFVMTRAAWERVTLDWERLTAEIESDNGLKSSLGWVREMYAFSVALAVHNITVDLSPGGKNMFISQLPLDSSLGEAHAYHYTQVRLFVTLCFWFFGLKICASKAHHFCENLDWLEAI